MESIVAEQQSSSVHRAVPAVPSCTSMHCTSFWPPPHTEKQKYFLLNFNDIIEYFYMHQIFCLFSYSEKDNNPSEPFPWIIKINITLIFSPTCNNLRLPLSFALSGANGTGSIATRLHLRVFMGSSFTSTSPSLSSAASECFWPKQRATAERLELWIHTVNSLSAGLRVIICALEHSRGETIRKKPFSFSGGETRCVYKQKWTILS